MGEYGGGVEKALHHGRQVGLSVLLVVLHLLLELLLGHAAEVAVLLHGLQQHVPLVVPLLGQGPEDLSLLGLGGIQTVSRGEECESKGSIERQETSLFGGVVTQWAASDTGEIGFRMTSKAWPEARLFMGLMSSTVCIPKPPLPPLVMVYSSILNSLSSSTHPCISREY
ncbi:hypothetical protein EYF80_028354 [Liparis tanakae]|uniref:Uncharacterized protein n=1 Tax=Liparis tanakae TaxID=230148 RepID=A0A4Z2H895_9TELE|nr:hypothetical protein EYF80_028354 [Liparis tanakae]